MTGGTASGTSLLPTEVVRVAPPYSKVVPRPRPGRWVAYLCIAVAAVGATHSVITNENFGWPTVADYFFSTRLLSGLVNTLWLTVIAMFLGVLIGVALAVMRMSSSKVIVGIASGYIWFFRGTPVFVQLLFWGYISALYPMIGLGVPGLAPFFEVETNLLITPVVAAILGLVGRPRC